MRERLSVSYIHINLVLDTRFGKSDPYCCIPWFFAGVVKLKVDYKIFS